jgi:rhodanese-related sulfurtransferase
MKINSELIYNKGSISITEFFDLKKSGELFQLIDVRQPEEHKKLAIKGAILIPLDTLESAIDKVDINKIVILYCRSGKRSAKAQDLLKRKGFEKTLNLKGGIIAWENYNNEENVK